MTQLFKTFEWDGYTFHCKPTSRMNNVHLNAWSVRLNKIIRRSTSLLDQVLSELCTELRIISTFQGGGLEPIRLNSGLAFGSNTCPG